MKTISRLISPSLSLRATTAGNLTPSLSLRGAKYKPVLRTVYGGNLNNLITALTLLILTTSCLRYVPSRREIEEDRGGSTAKFAGEEAFYSIDKQNKNRLQVLINQRLLDRQVEKEGTYRVGPEDLLEFTVFDVEELNRKVRVRPNGYISLPLIGTIMVEGFTESEVQTEVSKRLEKYVHSPQVQVFISEYAAHKVSVIGNVHQPGSYPLTRSNYSLIELISEAGGRTERASGKLILIPVGSATNPKQLQNPSDASTRAKLASVNPGNMGIEIPFDDLVGGLDRVPVRVPLRPGDTIVVPEAGKVQVDGEVRKPGSYQIASRMTLMGAIASAGGLTYSADVEEIEILRELGSGKKSLITVDVEKIALSDGNDIRLRNGDVVRVPSHGTRFVTRQVVESVNSALSFGLSSTVGP